MLVIGAVFAGFLVAAHQGGKLPIQHATVGILDIHVPNKCFPLAMIMMRGETYVTVNAYEAHKIQIALEACGATSKSGVTQVNDHGDVDRNPL